MLSTNNASKYVRNWTNRDSVPTSDHALLDYSLLLGQPIEETVKFNYQKAKANHWADFASELDKKLDYDFPDSGSYEDFNKTVDKFYQSIYEARDKTIPQQKVDPLRGSLHRGLC